jgi:uncharacterized protein YukE
MIKYVNGIAIEMTQEEIKKHNALALSSAEQLEEALNILRAKRNSLLTQTDWWGASDNTMTDAQKKYRQDLRDLTAGLDTVDKVNAVVWPTKP